MARGTDRLSVLLAAGCLAAGGLLYLEVTRPAFAPGATLPGLAAATPPAALPAWRMPPSESFAPVLARPLFTEGRRPPPGPLPAAAAKATRQALSLAVTAVILAPDRRLALVETGAGKTQTLSVGDTVDGWRLVEILAEHLVFAGGAERQRVALKDLPGVKPAAPAVAAAIAPRPAADAHAVATTVLIDGRQVEILPEHQNDRGEGSILAAVPDIESESNNP